MSQSDAPDAASQVRRAGEEIRGKELGLVRIAEQGREELTPRRRGVAGAPLLCKARRRQEERSGHERDAASITPPHGVIT